MDKKRHQRFWKPMGWFMLMVLAIISLPLLAWFAPLLIASFLVGLFATYLEHVFCDYSYETVWKTYKEWATGRIVSIAFFILSLIFYIAIMHVANPLNYTTYTLDLYPKIWGIAFGC